MSPKIKIKFAFVLSRKIGKTEIIARGKNFKDIVSSLKKELGEKFLQLFNEDETFKNPYAFLLGGKIVTKDELIKVEFKDNDVLQIFLPLAGG